MDFKVKGQKKEYGYFSKKIEYFSRQVWLGYKHIGEMWRDYGVHDARWYFQIFRPFYQEWCLLEDFEESKAMTLAILEREFSDSKVVKAMETGLPLPGREEPYMDAVEKVGRHRK